MLDNSSEYLHHITEYTPNSLQLRPDAVASDGLAGRTHNAAAHCELSRNLPHCRFQSGPRDAFRGAALGALVWLSLPGTPALALTPPEPFVLAADGVTKLTLEQAGILRSNGRKWALILGKALFWDHQAGSDGNACASCHFNAGADTRLRNQLNPGFNDITKGPNGDTRFGSERSDTGTVGLGQMPSGAAAGANYVLTPPDMPLHRLVNERDRNSPLVTTTNDRVSSEGAFDGTFTKVKVLGQPDKCQADGEIFHIGPLAARQVEPRNTPTAINAAFFHRNFWDGRANNLFNGVGVFGMRDIQGDQSKRLIVLNGGSLTTGYLKVENASLASQAVAPPINAVEMSCDGRTFADVGRKLLLTIPLLGQKVSRTDSVLGPYVSLTGKGLQLQYIYAALIINAFDPKYWSALGLHKINSSGQLLRDSKGYTQMETNFSMFWGISIMLYELSLVSDQSEFDTLQASAALKVNPFGGPTGCVAAANVDPLLAQGCSIFFRVGPGGGGCLFCHNAQGGGLGRPLTATGATTQPLLTEGTTQGDGSGNPNNNELFNLFLIAGDVRGQNALRDQGFAGLGLRPPFTDQMSGRTDPYGNPLSFGRQAWNYLKTGNPDTLLDPMLKRVMTSATGTDGAGTALIGGATALHIVPPPGTGPGPGNFSKLEVDGSAKAPGLRNVALTPPYFSWGGYPTLRQVLKTYNRGINRRDITAANAALDCDPLVDGTLPVGCGGAAGKTAANDDLAALERFLKSLTDPRVQCDQAPFDHPQLNVLNGHLPTDPDNDGRATDIVFAFPEIGAAGYSPSSGYCIPNSGDLFAAGMQARSGGAKIPLPTTNAVVAGQ